MNDKAFSGRKWHLEYVYKSLQFEKKKKKKVSPVWRIGNLGPEVMMDRTRVMALGGTDEMKGQM